jgi:hypothetical protein
MENQKDHAMKKYYLRLTLPLFMLLFASGCGSLLIQAPQPLLLGEETESLALITHFMAPLEQPATPVAAASTFNHKVDSMSATINKLMKGATEKYYQTLAGKMGGYTGFRIKTGKDFQESDRYELMARRAESEALNRGGKDPFRKIFIPEETFNAFDVDRESDFREFLLESSRARSTLRRYPRSFGTESSALGYTKLVLEGVEDFGRYAYLHLEVDVLFYDNRGDLVGHGYGQTEPLKTDGRTPADFREVLDRYPQLLQDILEKMIEKKEPEAAGE